MSRTCDEPPLAHPTQPALAREPNDSLLDWCAVGIRHRRELDAQCVRLVGQTRNPCHRDEVVPPTAQGSRTILTPLIPAIPELSATTRLMSVVHTRARQAADEHPRGYPSRPLRPTPNVLRWRGARLRCACSVMSRTVPAMLSGWPVASRWTSPQAWINRTSPFGRTIRNSIS